MMFKRFTTNKKGEKVVSIGVLLENGEFHVIKSETPIEWSSWKKDVEFEKNE